MKFLRLYLFASLVSVIGAFALLWVVYRDVVLRGIVALADNSNTVTAHSVLVPIRPALTDYLVAAAAIHTGDLPPPLPPEVDHALKSLMREAHIKRVKIYNRNGIVSASTAEDLIGQSGKDNPGFLSAMSGEARGNLVHRDTFNGFDRAVEKSNLYESYIPVRRRPTEPVLGVLEIYTDVGALMADAERTQFAILAAAVAVLVLLYGAQYFIVRHAQRTIDDQHRMIRDKTDLLERLSQRSQRREEHERKKLAETLHEGLAQTLSAIKLTLESGSEASSGSAGPRDVLKAVVPGLQEAIRQVRSLAEDLHPPSLDDLGLAATIRALCRQFGDAHRGLHVESRIETGEASVPSALQIVVYRNIEAGLRMIAAQPETTLVRVTLGLEDGTLRMSVEGNGVEPHPGLSDLAADTQSPLSAVRERTVISGGGIVVRRGPTGAIALEASWPL